MHIVDPTNNGICLTMYVFSKYHTAWIDGYYLNNASPCPMYIDYNISY